MGHWQCIQIFESHNNKHQLLRWSKAFMLAKVITDGQHMQSYHPKWQCHKRWRTGTANVDHINSTHIISTEHDIKLSSDVVIHSLRVSWTESWRSTPYATLQQRPNKTIQFPPTGQPKSEMQIPIRPIIAPCWKECKMVPQNATRFPNSTWFLEWNETLKNRTLGEERSWRLITIKTGWDFVARRYTQGFYRHLRDAFWKVTRWLAFGLEGQNQSTGVKFSTGYKDIMRRFES